MLAIFAKAASFFFPLFCPFSEPVVLLKCLLHCGCSRLNLGSLRLSVSELYRPGFCTDIYCLKVQVNWQLFLYWIRRRKSTGQIECCGIDTTCDSMCHFYGQFLILGAWILIEYYGFTMLFQDNDYMYFQRREGMYVCGVTCEQSVNASQLQEQNTKTCLGWFSFSLRTTSPVTG